jgi:hypothetical protein
VDDLARGWRFLLIAFAFACSPAKGEPVGVSNGGTHEHALDAAPTSTGPALAGLPADFRTSFRAVAKGVVSEHGAMSADVYERDASWAEDLAANDAGVGVYFLEHRDGGVRFAVGDSRGHTVADDDSDAGPSLEACRRCHAGAPEDFVFPIAR